MKLHRFCSYAELNALLNKGTVHNARDHYRDGRGGSTSRGFCFTTDPPERAVRYLAGIVCPEVCVTYDIPASRLTESESIYAEGADTDHPRRVKKREYCATEISLKWAKIVRVIEYKSLVTPDRYAAALLIWQMKHQSTPTF